MCLLFDGLLNVAMLPDEPDFGRRQSRVAIVKRTNKEIVSSSCTTRGCAVDEVKRLRSWVYENKRVLILMPIQGDSPTHHARPFRSTKTDDDTQYDEPDCEITRDGNV